MTEQDGLEDSAYEPSGEIKTLDLDEPLQTLSIAQRRIGLRIIPYNVVAKHPHYGALMFQPGAFGKVDPAAVRLRMDHADPPTGLGTEFTEREDGAYMDFALSKTPRAEEQLTLAVDGVSRGASIGFSDGPGRPKVQQIGGRNVTVYGPGSATLAEVSTTWQPTFQEAGVAYVLHRDGKGSGQMAEPQEAPASGADTGAIVDAINRGFAEGKSLSKLEELADRMAGVLDQQRELSRAQFVVPQGEARKPKIYDWAMQAIKLMTGKPVTPETLKALSLDDVVTTEQPGLVPEVFTNDFDDLVSAARPFVNSLRSIAPPVTGMTMTLPILTDRAVAYTQSGEKQEIANGSVAKVGTVTYNYVDFIGAADISIQFIERADASAVDLIIQEMAEANAVDAEDKGTDALLNLTSGGPVDGGTLDPESPSFGAAWQTSIQVYRRAPDTIWLSSAAVAAFIDAKSPITNAPLYSDLAASFTAASGTGGTLSGLRPVYVPTLDSKGIDVIIGPSRSYVFAEVPTRRLEQVEAAKLGRTIVLYGGGFFGPRYGAAFTTYTIAS